VLQVVQQEQQPQPAQMRSHQVQSIRPVSTGKIQRSGNGRDNVRRVGECSQTDVYHPIGMSNRELLAHRNGEACLTDPTRTSQRDKPTASRTDHLAQGGDVTISPIKSRRGHHQADVFRSTRRGRDVNSGLLGNT
jgi:hypothetical protein